MKPPSRATTTAAVGFLTLDALLLGYAGLGWERPGLLVAAGGCLLGAALVLAGWRRYRRALAELEIERREMKREVEEIRDLLFRKHAAH